MNPFVRATKARSRLRLALFGPSGSGKTYTALTLASAFGSVAVVDTERGSASKYADRFCFDVLELGDFHPQRYIEAIRAAEGAGYDVVVIDSLSHAWNGAGGVLEQVDRATKRSASNNKFTGWRDVTPLHNALIDALIGSSIHVIATMRSKTEYVLEVNERGKQAPRKVGLAPVQRDGMEYEFDVCGELTQDNELLISKSRCEALTNAVIPHPGIELGEQLLRWLSDGVEPERVETVLEPPPESGVDAVTAWLAEHADKAALPYTGALGVLYGAALGPIYSGVSSHMKASIEKAAAEGDLSPEMTVGEALLALRARRARATAKAS